MTGTMAATTIVITDDHRIVRDGLRALLARQADMEVVGESNNARDAVRLAVELKPDAIVMDVDMPGMSGITATAEIRAAVPSVKIIGLSMHADKRFIVGMFEAGASAYLLKESACEELARAIRLVTANEVFVSNGILTTMLDEAVRRAVQLPRAPEQQLTTREREVLRLLAEGCSTKAAAARLGIAVQTVSAHRARIMEKLGLHSVADLIRYAIHEGVVAL